MLKKIWALVWKDLYITYTDRSLILIMVATPLLLSTIISLAFGNLGGNDVPIKDIPVAVVNLDAGDANGANYGAIFVNALIPPETGAANNTTPPCDLGNDTADTARQNGEEDILLQLTDATLLVDAETARADVDNGDYTAAIIIPSDFSSRLSYSADHPEIQPVSVEVYANSGSTISASIIRSIAEGFTNQIAAGNIAIAATLEGIQTRIGLANFGRGAADFDFQAAFACAFAPALNPIDINQQNVEGENNSASILVFFGSAQAMFFMLFSAQASAGSMLEERRQGTLQRLHVSPTPRFVILIGKLLATLVMVIVQFALLAIFLTVVGSLISGGFVNIWGTNIPALLVVIFSAALSVSGIGAVIASAIRTLEQQQIVGSVVNLAIAGIGGGFGFQVSESVRKFSIIYWGTDAFGKLADGQTDIGLNLAILLVQGGVMFLIGLWLFNRRLAE